MRKHERECANKKMGLKRKKYTHRVCVTCGEISLPFRHHNCTKKHQNYCDSQRFAKNVKQLGVSPKDFMH